ncbi:MAG: hypothetical protein HY013_21740, partial [Candidatus Solibacter usitatus]|nr:hypothetical protein [Candidatus Solibacter usitatus]
IAVAMLALLLLARRQKSLGLLYALVAVYTLYYMFLVPVTFGWYTAPLAASAILLCAKGAGDLLRARPRLAWGGAAVYLGALVWVLPTTFTAERNIQQIVEEGIRAKIGRYLNEVAAPNQTIGCEPLGYIGYYSQRTIYDYPGLASRNVVAHIRTDPGKGLITVLRRFRPDFIVLRRQEMETYTRDKDGGFLLSEYHELRRFAVDQRDRQRLLFPDANIDTDFLVLKKGL